MGGQPVGYLHSTQRTNRDSSRMENLNQGPPDFKSSTLNYSATLPPQMWNHISSQPSLLKELRHRFSHLEKCSLDFSSSSFVIRVNLLHPCSIIINCYIQVSFNWKVILFVAKITKNTVTELVLFGGSKQFSVFLRLLELAVIFQACNCNVLKSWSASRSPGFSLKYYWANLMWQIVSE